MGTISCSKAQKTEFSKEALSEKLVTLDGKEISFKEMENGWKFRIGEQEFTYLLKGNPGKSHPKALLSQRLQHYLYQDEKIQPFCIPI